MSRKQVKRTESGKILRDESGALAYEATVSNIDALIIYIFVDDQLIRAKYAFIPEHSNRNDYIRDYDNIKRLLSSKYGSPKADESNWRNDLYRDDFDQWGFAISLGHLVYYATWETSSSSINLLLRGENYKINLGAEYVSKRLGQLEDNAAAKKDQSEF